jgi:hypothetical protein
VPDDSDKFKQKNVENEPTKLYNNLQPVSSTIVWAINQPIAKAFKSNPAIKSGA